MTGGSCGEVVRSILRSHCDGSQGDIDYVELFLDFENASPQDDERDLFDLCERLISHCADVLADVKSYGKVELANSISLFLATPTPMLSSLTTATLEFVQSHPMLPIGNTTDTLATIVSVCRYMVASPEVSARVTETTRLFCIRVMVGCLILYDHIDENGAFVRESPINLRAVVNVVKEQTQPPQTEALLNALRYTSKHFSQASTPKSVRAILA
ncbi:unnamed protein product [Angiostrongylus costaricensis]|uniref:DUF1394 domain-containing protein n=1 Tax=Angiostrongylus costaricensis TaxID=334426 RepID=A0A0R3PQS1_ANGCS|nr:unnamed protein product [Angiostrongylus costaricensis]